MPTVLMDNKIRDRSSASPCAVLSVLKPVLTLSRYLGVSPLELAKNDSKLILNKSSIWFYYSIFIFLLATVYMVFQIVSLCFSISNGNRIIDIVAQSNWMSAGLVSYAFTLLIYFRSEKVTKIFNDWSEMERDVEDLFRSKSTCKSRTILQLLYGCLAVCSLFFCGFHVFMKPEFPVYVLSYLKNGDGTQMQFSYLELSVYAIFQTLCVAWNWSGFLLLEISCSVIAMVFVQCLNGILCGLDGAFENFVEIEASASGESLLQMTEQKLKIITEEVYIRPRTSMNATELSHPKKERRMVQPSKHLLLGSIKDIQKIGSLQNTINNVLGPLLLLDFAVMIFMICGLFFLPLKYFRDFERIDALVYGGNGFCIAGRLVILIICLGNVYPASIDCHSGLARVMTNFNLDSCVMNPILAHISVISSNPICFTAWDFFPITRGTLLAAFSLLSTYLIVLMQMSV